MNKIFPKILIASPTASVKSYCDYKWIENCMNFKYPNFDIRLFDNTVDNSEYTRETNKWFKENYGSNKFEMINSLEVHNIKKSMNLKDRMALSHNDVREYALKNRYDYVLHLESDVFPELDCIENLLHNRKKICGALYYRDAGEHRRIMLQRHIYKSPTVISSRNFLRQDDLCFIDGTVKKVSHVGLGCVLIHRSVLAQVPFRNDPKRDLHPDSLFAEDCFRKNIKIFVDTSILCKHDNQDWNYLDIK